MASIKDLKGLDKLALFITGNQYVNEGDRETLSPLIQYWTSNSNISVIFSTIFSSISISLFVTAELNYFR